MADQKLAVPMRKSSKGEQIETRPMYVEEWLDGLPYIDFRKTSLLLAEATGLTNELTIKPATRLELVALYGRPYQYYIDSQIKAGAQHTLQSIETAREQVRVLKTIATNLARACKLSADESLKKKTLWKQSKPPLANLLYSLNYLSHALIFSYLEYSPTSRHVWREINFIYQFAESLRQENATINLPDSFTSIGLNTISGVYKRIVMSSLADPHHLPYGAIWEIYEQLKNWVDLIHITSLETPADDVNHFVVNLESDNNPIPYSKFNIKRASTNHRLISATDLLIKIQEHINIIESGRRLDKSILLSPYFTKMILDHLAVVWGRPPKRKNPRKERKGKITIACGMNEVYFYLNNETEFNPPKIPDPEAQDLDYEDIDDNHNVRAPDYKTDVWELIDQSSRGFAVIKNLKPVYSIRVGDLVIIDTKKTENKWAIGTVRWLMVKGVEAYKIGVQILSTNARPAAVRACSGSIQDTNFRRALVINQGDQKETAIISSKGMYIKNRKLELLYNDSTLNVSSNELKESTTGFELFTVNKRINL